MEPKKNRGILLSGGGARASYQAGVLQFIQDISEEEKGKIPFEILVGISAGAINLAVLATNANDFGLATRLMTHQWENITTQKVFKTSSTSFFFNAIRWFLDLAFGGAIHRKEPRGKSLVDTTPLSELIAELLPQGKIAQHIHDGILGGVAVTAMDYSSEDLTVFIESNRDRTLWERSGRVARYDQITPAHVLASCALPFLFPAVRIGDAYYGDGSIHNMAPISPAIHLGARKILAIGVQAPPVEEKKKLDSLYPNAAKISGVLLDSIFTDALDSDREQMERVNDLMEFVPKKTKTDRRTRLHKVDFFYIRPTKKLAGIALKHRGELPAALRYMLRGFGADQEAGAELLSYLLFEAGYCKELMELGYNDAREQAEEIRWFLWS